MPLDLASLFVSAEVTRRYASKNWVTVKLIVSGNHTFQKIQGSGAPLSQPFVFQRDQASRPINVFKDTQGKISFTLNFSFQYFYEGGMSHNANLISEGSREHNCSFDYTFPADARGPADLLIGNIVKTRGDDGGDQDGDPNYLVELVDWNADMGTPGGPKYIRIDPSFVFVTGSERPPQSKNDEGIGSFTIPLHTPGGSVILDGPNRGATITPIVN